MEDEGRLQEGTEPETETEDVEGHRLKDDPDRHKDRARNADRNKDRAKSDEPDVEAHRQQAGRTSADRNSADRNSADRTSADRTSHDRQID